MNTAKPPCSTPSNVWPTAADYDSVFLTLATEVAQPGDTEVHAP